MEGVNGEEPRSEEQILACRQKARLLSIQCLNAFSGAIELGAPLVMTHLLGLPNHYQSHQCVNVMWRSALAYVEFAFREAYEEQDDFVLTFTSDGKAV